MVNMESHARVERYKFTSFDGSETAKPVVTETAPAPAQSAQSELMAHIQEQEAPPPPPPPSFSEQEMEAAKQAAYQSGLTAGAQAADARRDKEAEDAASSLRSLLEVIANRVTLASEDHSRLLKNQQELNLKLSLGIARKIAGDALKREPYSSVEALLKECNGLIGGQERIVISVSPQKADGLRQSAESLKPYLQNFEGEMVIEADEAIADNDCRIEWNLGSIQSGGHRNRGVELSMVFQHQHPDHRCHGLRTHSPHRHNPASG